MTNKILENIFSIIKYEDHKIVKILGIKLKFKLVNKILLDKIDRLLIQNNFIEKNINNVNFKLKKEFLFDNIENPKFLDFEKEIYNFYTEMTSRKLYNIFQKRLSKKDIKLGIDKAVRKVNKKIQILTDVDYYDFEYPVITLDNICQLDKDASVILLIFNNDFSAIEAIKKIKKNGFTYISIIAPYPLARYFHIDKQALKTLQEESSNNNWHFCPGDFENIFQAIKITKDMDGDFVEIGTFRGDSGSAALNYMQKNDIVKKAYFLDTFTGFDYPEAYSSEDIYWQGTHNETSFEKVKERFSKYTNAIVIKSNIITDELPKDIEKICVANIDVDMYEAIKASLYKVKDKVVTNGIIICEDYGHTPALIGAQKAVNEFIEENKNQFLSIYLSSGQMFLIKK